jgi:uncharacterized membrane protein
MNTTIATSRTLKAFIILLWIALMIVSINFYLDNAVAYFFGYRNKRFGDSLLNNQLWFIAHMAGGTCALFLGPFQFWGWFRNRYIKIHRIMGQIYVGGTLIAGVAALRLSVIHNCEACRYSLLLLSLLLLFFTGAAFYSIKNYHIEAHKQFMVRSYVCALAFVFVRLPVSPLFFMVESDSERNILTEWFFSLVPLLCVELWFTWIPSLRGLVPGRS